MANPPVKVIKVGGISFSIWENDNDISIKFDGRTYKNEKTGEWEKTYYLNKTDVAKLKVATDQLFEWVFTENLFKDRLKKEENQKDDNDFKEASEYLRR